MWIKKEKLSRALCLRNRSALNAKCDLEAE